MQPLMDTDSERLMLEGIRTGQETFADFLSAVEWERADIDRTFCHQVGSTHRRLMLQSLELPMASDFCTFPWLGNTGSAALPVTMAIGLMRDPRPGSLALLGIGSGICSVMLAVDWQRTAIEGRVWGDGEQPFELHDEAELADVPNSRAS